MNILNRFLVETIRLFNEMSPYLLFGFLIAGILKILIPKEKVYQHLSPSSFLAVLKATLIGIPLPLCSCGVIPVATHIKKEGASNGATASFLISTPTTGVDSILATYSLLGWLFAVIRPISALFAGLFAGILINKYSDTKKDVPKTTNRYSCNICEKEEMHAHTLYEKIKGVFKYGFIELTEDAGKWILSGIIIGAIISTFIPVSFISKFLGRPLYSYIFMALIGTPLYICATGSIPIAASLIAKGMSPGAGLVFLFTGPATNTTTLLFVLGKFGKKSFFIYLFSIILWAVIFGLILDHFWVSQLGNIGHTHQNQFLNPTIKGLSSFILLFLILRTFRFKRRGKCENMKEFNVPDMKCAHCEKTIKKVFKKEGIDVVINLKKKKIYLPPTLDKKTVADIIGKAGYTISNNITAEEKH